MMMWVLLDRKHTTESLGFIPSFLSDDDPRPAREQLDAHYQHGGGWCPQDKFTLGGKGVLHYPGDPPLKPIAMTGLRDEIIRVYPHGYVCVEQPDGDFEVARMD